MYITDDTKFVVLIIIKMAAHMLAKCGFRMKRTSSCFIGLHVLQTIVMGEIPTPLFQVNVLQTIVMVEIPTPMFQVIRCFEFFRHITLAFLSHIVYM